MNDRTGKLWLGLLLIAALCVARVQADTVALWLFDEPEGLYPSSVLNDASGNGITLILGRGAHIVEGRFGRALEAAEPAPLKIRGGSLNPQMGLLPVHKAAGRTVEPMSWRNATFCTLSTKGEKHLRSPELPNTTDTKLNLGSFDWTVEFWFLRTDKADGQGVIFELGEGPRGEDDHVTRLALDAEHSSFTLENRPSGTTLRIPSDVSALRSGAKDWHHLAFVYSASEQQLRHYVDGALQALPARAALKTLAHGDEAYFGVGRDGLWARPLPGRLDELRFSDQQVYTAAFQPPGSFSVTYGKGLPKVTLKAGPPLLFGKNTDLTKPIELGSRKHMFIDDALVAETQGITFMPNPPRRVEQVLEDVHGHLSLVEDENGILRLYHRGPGDSLAVMTSRDGIHWEKPDLGHGEYHGERNVVLRKPVALGNVFIDPNAPPESRWKYFSGIRKQAMFVFTSPDGWWFEPHEVAALPFASGSQSVVYYDDQRQLYVGHHRSDYGMTPGGHTRRRFVVSETKEILGPWPWERIT